METFLSLAGQLLLAMPGIGDDRFDHAVIAMCVHDEDGALGVGIGGVVPGLGLHALMAELSIDPGTLPDAAIHRGGPVEPQRGFVLHSPDWSGDDTLHVGERWALTGTLDVLRALGAGAGPDRWLVSLGYAGWGARQLDDEMTRHGWFVAPVADDLVFEVDTETRWAAAFARVGVDTRLLAHATGHA